MRAPSAVKVSGVAVAVPGDCLSPRPLERFPNPNLGPASAADR